MTRAVTAAAVLAMIGAVALSIPGARASTEEFSTFDVLSQEEDDESLLDHFVTRQPRWWRDEWERAPLAIRTSQGCLTSGRWFIETDLKLRSPIGSKSRFGLDLKQSESDVASYDYLDFSLQFQTPYGKPGVMFRPLYDKSRQDFAVSWEAGSDTARLQLQAIFTLEDMFNNLWAWRQTRVGVATAAYGRHPYEPGLRFVSRNPNWRAEVIGRYLTPSVMHISGDGVVDRVTSLWGTYAYATLEARRGAWEWEARTANRQAKSTDQPLDFSTGNNHDFRRSWNAETGLRRSLGRLGAEVRWLYQERSQTLGPPRGPTEFRSIDRLVTLEAHWLLRPNLRLRVGGLHDDITVEQSGAPQFTYGSRVESRAYVGLMARFGPVSVSVVEGLELDEEPYDVWGVHDKGFLHLQATF